MHVTYLAPDLSARLDKASPDRQRDEVNDSAGTVEHTSRLSGFIWYDS